MNTGTSCGISVATYDETKTLTTKLAARLEGNEIIELISDLGGGKTTFTRLLAEALGSQDQASSPSFTLQNVYRLPGGEMHHFDFYRLDEPGLMADELQQSVGATDVITVVEWANIVRDVLPPEHLRIEISSTGDTSRLFTFTASPTMGYLLEGLQ